MLKQIKCQKVGTYMLRTLEVIDIEIYSIFHHTVQMELLSTTTN
jgi:hypothetical protein